MKKTITDKQFEIIVKASKAKSTGSKVGHTRIGRGNYTSPLGGFFEDGRLRYWDSWGARLRVAENNGDRSDLTYYVNDADFTKFLKKYDPTGARQVAVEVKLVKKVIPKPEIPVIDPNKLGSFIDQKKYAESFDKKVVVNGKKIGRVRRGYVFTDENYLTQGYFGEQKASAKLFLETQGFFTALEVTTPRRDSFYVLAHSVYFVPVEGKLPVEVNGYKAIKKKDVVNFGCANIDIDYLREARDFLKKVGAIKNKGNRDLKKLAIGSGFFTLDILNDLELG